MVSKHDHVVFVDDLSALTEGCINFHRKAAEEKTVLCGAYDKVSDIVIENNKVVSYKAKNIDGRAKVQPDEKSIKIGGGWVFGQNVSFPIEFLEKINGYDEFLARRGCEDCNIGVRLEIAGYSDKIFYNKNCLIIEDERMHWCDVNPVDDIYPKRIWKSDYEKHVAVSEFMLKTMNEIEHRNLYVEKNFKTIDTNFNLLQEKELYQNTGQFKPVGDCDYFDFDGENISQI